MSYKNGYKNFVVDHIAKFDKVSFTIHKVAFCGCIFSSMLRYDIHNIHYLHFFILFNISETRMALGKISKVVLKKYHSRYFIFHLGDLFSSTIYLKFQHCISINTCSLMRMQMDKKIYGTRA